MVIQSNQRLVLGEQAERVVDAEASKPLRAVKVSGCCSAPRSQILSLKDSTGFCTRSSPPTPANGGSLRMEIMSRPPEEEPELESQRKAQRNLGT